MEGLDQASPAEGNPSGIEYRRNARLERGFWVGRAVVSCALADLHNELTDGLDYHVKERPTATHLLPSWTRDFSSRVRCARNIEDAWRHIDEHPEFTVPSEVEMTIKSAYCAGAVMNGVSKMSGVYLRLAERALWRDYSRQIAGGFEEQFDFTGKIDRRAVKKNAPHVLIGATQNHLMAIALARDLRRRAQEAASDGKPYRIQLGNLILGL